MQLNEREQEVIIKALIRESTFKRSCIDGCSEQHNKDRLENEALEIDAIRERFAREC